jgi:hypothetical protein
MVVKEIGCPECIWLWRTRNFKAYHIGILQRHYLDSSKEVTYNKSAINGEGNRAGF